MTFANMIYYFFARTSKEWPTYMNGFGRYQHKLACYALEIINVITLVVGNEDNILGCEEPLHQYLQGLQKN